MPTSKKKKVIPRKKSSKLKVKRKRNRIIFLLLILLGIAFVYFMLQSRNSPTARIAGTEDAPLRELYVSINGNDQNNGSKSSPLATINKAASIATPGTLIHVAPGTYHETIITNTSGTQENTIVYLSDEKWGAKINSPGDAASTDSTWENNGNFVEIKGFDVSGGKRIGILNRGGNVKLSGNYVHDVAVGFCSNTGGAGIDTAYSTGKQGNEYIGNLIENIGLKPCSYVHGIYLQEANEKALNNVINNVGGIGIACTHACNSPVIANNTIINSGYGIRIGWSLSNPAGKTENAIVANNIIMGSLNYTLYQYLPGIGNGNEFTNNLFFSNRVNICSSPTGSNPLECKNTITQNPLFERYQAAGSIYGNEINVHLTAQSPAINKGINIQNLTSDFDNNLRPQQNSFDMGALEYTINHTPTPTETISEPTQKPRITCQRTRRGGCIWITTYPTKTPSPTMKQTTNEPPTPTPRTSNLRPRRR